MENFVLKGWTWLFKFQWMESALETMQAFAEFADTSEGKELVLPGPMRLRGNVYSRQDYEDGTLIETSTIVKIERAPLLGAFEDDPNAKMFVAVTESGSRYQFRLTGPDGMSADQFLSMGAIFNGDTNILSKSKIWTQ